MKQYFTPGRAEQNQIGATLRSSISPAGRRKTREQRQAGRNKKSRAEPLRLVEQSGAAPNQNPNWSREQGGEERGRGSD